MAAFLAWLTAPWMNLGGWPLSPGDLAGFATGLACVGLAARGSIYNFPMGLANCAVLGLVFWQTRLFGDMGLQAVFFALGVMGWVRWARLGAGDARPRPIRKSDFLAGAPLILLLTVALRELLVMLGGAAPWPDAFITSASLWAQWLLNRKSIASWPWWILIDLVSIPLYLSRGLPLIALLYGIFLGLCVTGWMRWRAEAAR